MRARGPVLFTLLLLAPVVCAAETVAIEADRDATLIENPDGALANGSGPVLFAGRNDQAQNGIRRGLLHFDVASVLPRGAIIESVSLRLYHTGSNAGTRAIRLHRVLADWGEGPSSAAGGGGAASQLGDATWLHRFHDYAFWTQAGGQFVGHASAQQDVGPNGYYTWESTEHLVQDVRLWNAAPQRNFGWILIGDETTRQNAKRFAARENADATIRPLLEVTYRLPGGGRGFPR